jgi:hypothetical protein
LSIRQGCLILTGALVLGRTVRIGAAQRQFGSAGTTLRTQRLCLSLLAALLLGLAARPGETQTPAPISFLSPITYDRPVAYPLAGAEGVPLLTADLDGDGRLDLVVFTQEGISLLYGNGDGTLGAPLDYVLGQNLQEGAAVDVNGDGRLDLVICHRGLGKVLVLLNQGERRFAAPVNYAVGAEPLGVVAGDFNGDGKADLAISGGGAATVIVLINRGDGTFQTPVSYRVAQIPSGIVAADFDGDGVLDLAYTSLTENVVGILLGDGKGKFKDGGRYTTGAGNANRLVTDDFNGDGIPDVAVASSGTISLLFGDGNGRFSGPILYDGYHLFDKGDFDGDGDPDLVTPGVRSGVGGFFIHENREAGNFLAPRLIPGPGDRTRGVRVGDFNGDGRPDVVAWNESSPHLAIFLNDTPRPTPAVLSLTVDPANVIGGCQSTTGVITLTGPAPAGGVAVALNSTNPAITVPMSVKVTEGATSVSFTPTLSPVTITQTGAITAALPGSAKRVSVTVRPGGVAGLKLAPTSVTGGQPAAGEVTFPCPAPRSGITVTLGSSQPQVVQVPATLRAEPGATGVSFPLATQRVSAATSVVITATFDGMTRTATLEVQPVPPPPPPPAVNLLVNGSFEEPNTSTSTIGWLTYGPVGLPGHALAAPTIPGWKITGGTVDVTSWYWPAADGKQSLDLVGDNTGTIEQSFATETGREYIFSGWIAHNPANFYLPEGRGNVFLNGTFFLQLVHRDASATTANMRWTPFSARFRATAPMTTLTISDATGSPFPGGLVLDGLAVTPAGTVSPASAGPPAVPTVLTARAVSATQIDLTWKDNSSNEDQFILYRKSGSGDYARIGQVNANTTRYSDRGLSPNTTYTYLVRAWNPSGASRRSNEASATTPPAR